MAPTAPSSPRWGPKDHGDPIRLRRGLLMSKEKYPTLSDSSMVTEFVLLGFSDVLELRASHAVLFLLIYLATLTGNLLIVMVTTFEQGLHTPMYFFLRNLSVLDMGYIFFTVPKVCVVLLLDSGVISVAGCEAQIFLVLVFALPELLFLTVMACDRCVAVCLPLSYPAVMSPQLFFCRSNVVHQFFRDIPSLLRLSCSDTFSNEIAIFVCSVGIAGGCFAFIAVSYVYVFATVLRAPTGRERGKAFSACVPHTLVVTVSVSSAAAVRVKPSSTPPTIQDTVTSMLYSIVPPLSNPVIYSLGNQQIKEAVQRTMRRFY
ncbi:olfactory receptor 14C36-like [Manis javanica]|uniref:olfactory receptor 14C36-like n=1 Tax=Manis javanica TaxID=9974 RepID=UPI003C6D68AC